MSEQTKRKQPKPGALVLTCGDSNPNHWYCVPLPENPEGQWFVLCTTCNNMLVTGQISHPPLNASFVFEGDEPLQWEDN